MGVAESFDLGGILLKYPAHEARDEELRGLDTAQIDRIAGDGAALRRWPSAIRDLYLRAVTERLYHEQHFMFLLGFAVCLATLAIDYLVHPELLGEGAVLRVLTVAPLTLLGMFAADRGWTRLMAFCLCACPIAFVAAIVHLSSHMEPTYAASYLTATTLVIGLANIVMPLSIRAVALFDIGFIATVTLVVSLLPGDGLARHVDYLLLLCVVAGSTLPLAYRFEKLREHNFLLTLRARIASADLREANWRLRELSERDPLTGVLNRRGFERVFDEDLCPGRGGPECNGEAVALMMIDLDHFKQFNDSHGHQAGDTCLVLVANALDAIFAETGGVAARYGGEEFIAALPHCSTEGAVEVAETVRRTVATMLLPVGPEDMARDRSLITASIGIGTTRDCCMVSREDLIEMADAALYAAKHGGRNRVEIVEGGDAG